MRQRNYPCPPKFSHTDPSGTVRTTTVGKMPWQPDILHLPNRRFMNPKIFSSSDDFRHLINVIVSLKNSPANSEPQKPWLLVNGICSWDDFPARWHLERL